MMCRVMKIGVEPVMFLYMSAFMTTTVVEESFFIYKACRANLGFPEDVCRHINQEQYKNYSSQVQVEVSLFHQYQNIAAYSIPVILAFIVGAWSDRVGRKLPLLLGLSGSIIYSVMIIINAVNGTMFFASAFFSVSWPLEVVLFTATLPCALSGGQLTVFMSCFAYLADTTTQEQRTLRVTLLEVVYLLPMPLGIAFGGYLFGGPLKGSFAQMFGVNATLLGAALLYAFVFLPWRTQERGQGPACTTSHITDTIKTLFLRRKEGRRTLLILSLFGMILYTLQRDEKRMMQIYTMNIFHWGTKEFSHFKTFMSSFYIIGLLLGVPLLKYIFKLKEVYIMIVGALSHIAARIAFMTADKPIWFDVGAVLCTFGPAVAPMLRSITSKLVPSSERGKVFALLSVADTTVPLFSGFVFSQVYIHTFNTSFPSAVFLVTLCSQVIVFGIAVYMNYVLHGKNVTQAQEECEDTESFQ